MKNLVLLLISMSAAGTLSFILYLALSTVFDNYISARFRYGCLKYCLLLYLVPFPLLKYFIYHQYFNVSKPLSENAIISLGGKFVQTSSGFYLNSIGHLQKILIGLWIFTLSVVIFYEIITFVRFHRKVSQNILSDPRIIKILKILLKEMKLKRKVTVYENNFTASPFTYGIFYPSIVLTSSWDKNDLHLIIRHELQHIRSHDFLFRQLAFLVLILHCYNPFVYFFFHELKEIQELACDENVMKYLSREDQRRYGYLLIMIAAKEEPEMKSNITLMFSEKKRDFFKKRIKRIGVFVKPKYVLNISIIIIMIIISCIPVFAYNPPTADLRSVPWTGFFNPAEGAQISVFNHGNEITYIAYDDECDTIPSDENFFKYTDTFFITYNGEIISVEPTDIQALANCSHTFVNGTLKKHLRNSRGGCSVKTYKGKICKKCNYTKNLSLESTVTYSPCQH
ncbi:hypothetical protein DW958_07200 [Ruminococcus sp. AM46-18]|nr:hypothetical protein DW958_07200 [Ruminococcus sp. AM46-18]